TSRFGALQAAAKCRFGRRHGHLGHHIKGAIPVDDKSEPRMTQARCPGDEAIIARKDALFAFIFGLDDWYRAEQGWPRRDKDKQAFGPTGAMDGRFALCGGVSGRG